MPITNNKQKKTNKYYCFYLEYGLLVNIILSITKLNEVTL